MGRTAGIVLAAGASARLGRPKQFLRLGGEPLLRRAARLALAAGASPVYAVVRGEHVAAASEALRGLGVECVDNPEAGEGMSASLRCGMAALLRARAVPERVLLMTCDQPLVTEASLRRLLDAAPTAGIAASAYAGRVAAPAVFSTEHFEALATVSGDQGARALLRALPATAVPMPEAEADIDTPDDLALLAPVH